jgi:hypothetical protein
MDVDDFRRRGLCIPSIQHDFEHINFPFLQLRIDSSFDLVLKNPG